MIPKSELAPAGKGWVNNLPTKSIGSPCLLNRPANGLTLGRESGEIFVAVPVIWRLLLESSSLCREDRTNLGGASPSTVGGGWGWDVRILQSEENNTSDKINNQYFIAGRIAWFWGWVFGKELEPQINTDGKRIEEAQSPPLPVLTRSITPVSRRSDNELAAYGNIYLL